MPKPMYMTIAVEEAFYGKVFRTLDTMPGVVSLSPHSEMKQAANSNSGGRGQKRGGTQSSECVILGALMTGPKLRAELVDILTNAGKSGTTAPGLLLTLTKKKHVAKKDDSYQITAGGKKRFQTACEVEAA